MISHILTIKPEKKSLSLLLTTPIPFSFLPFQNRKQNPLPRCLKLQLPLWNLKFQLLLRNLKPPKKIPRLFWNLKVPKQENHNKKEYVHSHGMFSSYRKNFPRMIKNAANLGSIFIIFLTNFHTPDLLHHSLFFMQTWHSPQPPFRALSHKLYVSNVLILSVLNIPITVNNFITLHKLFR